VVRWIEELEEQLDKLVGLMNKLEIYKYSWILFINTKHAKIFFYSQLIVDNIQIFF
jgi:hypothetical protein